MDEQHPSTKLLFTTRQHTKPETRVTKKLCESKGIDYKISMYLSHR